MNAIPRLHLTPALPGAWLIRLVKYRPRRTVSAPSPLHFIKMPSSQSAEYHAYILLPDYLLPPALIIDFFSVSFNNVAKQIEIVYRNDTQEPYLAASFLLDYI